MTFSIDQLFSAGVPIGIISPQGVKAVCQRAHSAFNESKRINDNTGESAASSEPSQPREISDEARKRFREARADARNTGVDWRKIYNNRWGRVSTDDFAYRELFDPI